MLEVPAGHPVPPQAMFLIETSFGAVEASSGAATAGAATMAAARRERTYLIE